MEKLSALMKLARRVSSDFPLMAAISYLFAKYGVLFALHLAGFGTEGITFNSVAAKLMSYIAKRTGGRILRGSIVSLLQRIGVIGLGNLAIGISVTAFTIVKMIIGIYSGRTTGLLRQ
uniref:AlNc14C203G8753 protein n=1 Tax=Albugo laibachii Nc14 TaxID=890382 RepID=F0W7X5_9STRA|nr:AlNc14C32G2925 [Albugo laibachii Nc14]CCA23703.1 AlNc14C203G8753 [Albugo laibachii Nc14]|eukprot:CCA23703.1 AlNc14C203G8753 [Albugo laibachii Nc14]